MPANIQSVWLNKPQLQGVLVLYCTVVVYSNRHSSRHSAVRPGPQVCSSTKRSRGAALHENVAEPFISDTQDP